MKDFMENFSVMLKTERRAAGMSQAALARMIGVNMSTYNYYESGKLVPNVKAARQLSLRLGLPSESLLFPEKYSTT